MNTLKMDEWTEGEKANNNFFGNAVGIDMQLDELKIYLKEVHNFIKITYINLQSDRIHGLDSETLENLSYHFEHTQGEILRKSIIISIVILLEAEIDTYCEDFRKHKKLSIGYNNFKGDLLEKFKTFTSKLLQSDFNFQGILWQDIVGLYEIRNSLVHNSGLVSDFGKRKTIENFICRNKSFEIDDNERIIISHQACLESIKIVETFFNEITDFALRVFPDRHHYINGTEPF
ncbi:hypothetical protein J2786_003609 [Chryseobacterium vietnamense]|uniref:Uncharacterized protein n=1 Tax=Chryseobacterium vietnamense TaxID=866785 RepID=A0ACC6JBP6_9FLAO|nr:hypothetical protein [Chryseobacterium vietnamense]MDR6460475.1 hypothetical protein [Chryseobacterium vietnamense]